MHHGGTEGVEIVGKLFKYQKLCYTLATMARYKYFNTS
jgi:hypothetical protein